MPRGRTSRNLHCYFEINLDIADRAVFLTLREVGQQKERKKR